MCFRLNKKKKKGVNIKKIKWKMIIGHTYTQSTS